MEITLAKDVEEFVREKAGAGSGSGPSDLVNDVLRAVRDQQIDQLFVTPELESWLLEAADRPSTPLTSADFQTIRARVLGEIAGP
jgi:hypothetical protein